MCVFVYMCVCVCVFVQIMQARREVARRKEAIRQARLLLMRKIAASIHFQRVYRGHMARSLRRRLEVRLSLLF